MLCLCTAVLVGWALSAAEAVFAPLAFALFIIAIVALQRRLQAVTPRLLALAVSMAATILVLIVFLTLVSWALGRVYRFMISDVARLQALFNSVTGWLEDHGIVLAGLWADAVSVSWLIRLAQQIASLCQTAVSFSIVVIAFVMLGLLEVDHAIGKLRAWRRGMLVGTLKVAPRQPSIRRYMLVRTLMSVATGVLVSAFAWLSDLPLVVEWEIIAFT